MKNKKNDKKGLSAIPLRLALVVVLFGIWFVVVAAKIVDLQTVQSGKLRELARQQRERRREFKPLRGAILDRNGLELAITIPLESLVVDPKLIDNPELIAYKVAPILGEKSSQMLAKINEAKANNSRFLWLAREIEKEKVEKIKALNLPALDWRVEQKRFYPHGSLAAHVVGYGNLDDIGQSGVERSQDSDLRGEDRKTVSEKDGKGNVFEVFEYDTTEPRDVVLTIDQAVQYEAEKSLAEGLRETNAKSGAAIVINPKNGEILALAVAPTFDLNKVGAAAPENRVNRAVQDTYEPGSTFKLIAYSAALEEGLITPSSEINCQGGVIRIGTRTIKDSHSAGVVSATEALAKSSNVAAITLAQRLGKNKFYEYVKKYGFGSPTESGLPSESRGKVRAVENWSDSSLASMAIGYEIAATTMQTATAYAAIANDGVRVQPHIVKQIRQQNGGVLKQFEPTQTRIVKAETAKTLRRMLREVTTNGTAKRARIALYSTAGKTGTANKAEVVGHRADGRAKLAYTSNVVASFVGFAPVENPSVVIAVMVDSPRGGARFGGDVAAPIFSKIAARILPEMNVIPDEPEGKSVLAANIQVNSNAAEDEPQGVAPVETDDEIETTQTAKNIAADNKKTSAPKEKTFGAKDAAVKEKQTPKNEKNSDAEDNKKTTVEEKPKASEKDAKKISASKPNENSLNAKVSKTPVSEEKKKPVETPKTKTPAAGTPKRSKI